VGVIFKHNNWMLLKTEMCRSWGRISGQTAHREKRRGPIYCTHDRLL